VDKAEVSNVQEWSIVERLPSPADYNRVRELVGWGTYDEDVIAGSLPQSLYCVCAEIEGEVVGMARVIGDGGMVFYVQDVIVVPGHQRRGIGTQMMDRAMAYVAAHAYHNSIVGLMAAKGKEAFYIRYGFVARPTDTLGAGMIMFWKA
jgi:GNAT superfamily N-acetyltransferase